MTKNQAKNSILSNSRGQGTLEYTLLLLITIAILTALAQQIFKPFNRWLQNYMGSYLECLLDVGELPSLGYGEASGECNNLYESASVAFGRPPKNVNLNGQQNPGNSGTNKNGNGENGGGDSSNTGNRQAGNSGNNSGRNNNIRFNKPNNTGADGLGKDKNKVIQTPVDLADTQFYKVNTVSEGYNQSVGRRIRAVGLAGLLASEKEKIKKREQKIQKLKVEEGDTESIVNQKKFVVKPPVAKEVADEAQEEWTIGKFMRYAIILLLIIAIILFLGGQALQISKSMDG